MTTKDFLEAVRRPWIRHRLQRHVRSEARTTGICAGNIEPHQLSAAERATILEAFDLAMLDRFAASNDTLLFELLGDLAVLDLPPSVRAGIWREMAAGLNHDRLRRELWEMVPQLPTPQEVPHSTIWGLAILRVLRQIASTTDPSLSEIADAAEASGQVLTTIAAWVSRLSFQALEPVSELASEPLPEMSEDAPVDSFSEERGVEPAPTSIDTLLCSSEPLQSIETSTSALERWVLGLRLPDPMDLSVIRDAFHEAILGHFDRPINLVTVDGVCQFTEQLTSLKGSIEGWLRRLPTPSTLLADLAESHDAYECARRVLGNDLELLPFHRLQPETLREIANILSQQAILDALPPWIWDVDGEIGAALPTTSLERAERLLNPVTHARIQRALRGFADVCEDNPALLNALPLPTANEDRDQYIDDAIRRLGALQFALRGIRPEYRPWIDAALKAEAKLEALLRSINLLEELRPRLNSEVFARVVAGFGSVPATAAVEERVRILHDSVAFLEQNFGSATNVGFDLIEQNIAVRGRTLTADSAPTQQTDSLEFDHDYIDRASRALLVFQQLPNEPYGIVRIPLVIKTNQARTFHLRLTVELRTDQRQTWPDNWVAITPTELTIPLQEWRPSPDRARSFIFSFMLMVPMRAPQHPLDTRVEVFLKAVDATTGATIVNGNGLRWDSVATNADAIPTIDWRDGLVPQYVKDSPIGPQKQHGVLERRLRKVSSFAVIAPRRFGKSTLVEYLKKEASNAGLLCVTPILCTRYFREGVSFDYAKLWEDVSRDLNEQLGASLPRTIGELPTAAAFDFARRKAKQDGKTGIALLFDEAQLFFPRNIGSEIGTRLKDLLEYHWCRDDDPAMVKVLIGFVGLPSLLDRAGANLTGQLRPLEDYEVKEGDLHRLIRRVTEDRLQTTREARVELARTAGNLYILSQLLERLAARVGADYRRWANYDDVIAVETAQRKELREGRGTSTTMLMRDAVNEADGVDQWRPSPCYPVAVALAAAGNQGFTQPSTRRARAIDLLNGWSASLRTDSTHRPVFTDDRLSEHLVTLRERGLFDGIGFQSELFEAWLVGVARGFPQDEQDRRALEHAAAVRVKIVAPLEAMGEGREASVFRFTEEKRQFAVRRVKLCSERDRRTFIESYQMLQAIIDSQHRRQTGSEYIFELRAIGLAEEDENTALQVYAWIDGGDLESMVGTMTTASAAFLGYKLALAVQLLHGLNILHRDIRPKNIILATDELRPVLIDFGLARFASDGLHTRIAGTYAAPEVAAADPQWSTSADIYALGKTLSALVAPEDPNRSLLDHLLLPSIDPLPACRPTAVQLVEQLANLQEKLSVAQQTVDAWRAVVSEAGVDYINNRWFAYVVDKFRPHFECIALGLFGTQFDRCAESADFLNHVMEALPNQGPDPFNLHRFKRELDRAGASQSSSDIQFLHYLRIRQAHGRSPSPRHILREAGCNTPADMRMVTERGAALVASRVSLPCLLHLVRRMLGS